MPAKTWWRQPRGSSLSRLLIPHASVRLAGFWRRRHTRCSSRPSQEQLSFTRAVVYYPACRWLRPWKNTTPVLMLLAGADDVAPGDECEEVVKNSATPSAVKIVIYSGEQPRPVSRPRMATYFEVVCSSCGVVLPIGHTGRGCDRSLERRTAELTSNYLAVTWEAQAARRVRLALDNFDERDRLVAVEFDFLRFGRDATAAAGGECIGATRGDSGRSVGRDGAVGTKACDFRLLFTCSRPKASLTIAPYQAMAASAACIQSSGARVEGLSSCDASRCSDLMRLPPASRPILRHSYMNRSRKTSA